MSYAASVDPEEIEKFSRMAEEWWDPFGKFKPLHEIAPVRIGFIREQAETHFGMDRESLTPFTGRAILDIGCGGGLVAEPMARLGGNVTAIDASEKNIATAKTHANASGLTIDYRCMTAESLASSGATFDIVLCLEVVEHVADLTSFMHAVTTLVKPGGLLMLSTINRTAKAFLMAIVGAEYVMRWLPRGTHQYEKFLKPSELAALLRPHGFEIATMKGMVYSPFTQGWSLSEKDVGVNYLLCARRA